MPVMACASATWPQSKSSSSKIPSMMARRSEYTAARDFSRNASHQSRDSAGERSAMKARILTFARNASSICELDDIGTLLLDLFVGGGPRVYAPHLLDLHDVQVPGDLHAEQLAFTLFEQVDVHGPL